MNYSTRRKVTGYGTVQTAVLQLPISQKAKLVYCLLASYTGKSENCFPSLSTICTDLQMGRTTVTEALKELQAVDLVDVERRPNNKGYFDSNLYYVHEIVPCSESEHGETDLMNKVKKANDYKSISKKTARVRKLNTDKPVNGGSPEPVPPPQVVPVQDWGSPHSGLGVVLPQDCNNTSINSNIEQSFIFPPNGENIKVPVDDSEGQPRQRRNPGKKDTPPGGAPPPLTKTLHQPFIDTYHTWYMARNGGVKPQIQAKDAKAVKTLIGSMIGAVKGAAEAKKEIMPEQDLPDHVLKGWSFMLSNWDKLTPFLQQQTDLAQISSNFNNIITQIKNGHGTSGKLRTINPGTATNAADYVNGIAQIVSQRLAGKG